MLDYKIKASTSLENRKIATVDKEPQEVMSCLPQALGGIEPTCKKTELL